MLFNPLKSTFHFHENRFWFFMFLLSPILFLWYNITRLKGRLFIMDECLINQNWSFKEVVENIEEIKTHAMGIITSFSYFERKQAIVFMKQLRDSIYSLNFETWRCDRLVEFIYDDIDLETLQKLI